MKKMMFNDRYGLTEAVLFGRKTQTRRLMKINDIEAYLTYFNKWVCEASGKTFIVQQAKYKVGEIVAVAQCYKDAGIVDCPSPIEHVYYEARNLPGWTNKMLVRADLMPHKIRITNVRVERLQDISDEDCEKEGIYKDESTAHFNGHAFEISKDQYGSILAKKWHKTPREAYAALIDLISGNGTWESNPYVFVYDFILEK